MGFYKKGESKYNAPIDLNAPASVPKPSRLQRLSTLLTRPAILASDKPKTPLPSEPELQSLYALTHANQNISIPNTVSPSGAAHGHRLYMPTKPTYPLLLSSPHSGRHYPDGFLAQSGLTPQQIRLSEDSYVDVLIEGLIQNEIPALIADFPRSCVDVNRARDELSPPFDRAGSTPRAQIGFGVIPTHITPLHPLYHRDLTKDQIEARLQALYIPYHHALEQSLSDIRQKFGRALLIDVHSMPGAGLKMAQQEFRLAKIPVENTVDIVLGDRFGQSCHGNITDELETLFIQKSYRVARNHPYAGGYNTEHYGRAASSVQAIQIEINKDLYLNYQTLEPNKEFEKLQNDMTDIISSLGISMLSDKI